MYVCVFPSSDQRKQGILIKFGMNNTEAFWSNIGYVSMTLTLSNRPGSIATKLYSDRFGPNLAYHLPMTINRMVLGDMLMTLAHSNRPGSIATKL